MISEVLKQFLDIIKMSLIILINTIKNLSQQANSDELGLIFVKSMNLKIYLIANFINVLKAPGTILKTFLKIY